MSHLKDPTTQYYTGEYPKQKQPTPGIQAKMTPVPDCGEKTYVGSGRLKDRKALVTGGDSGIGRAAAIAYAREGADVAISYLPVEEEDAQDVKKIIEECGRKAVLLPGDLSDEKFARSLVHEAHKALGGLDIMALVAGKQVAIPDIADLTSEQFQKTFAINVFALFWLTQEAIPLLPKGASIITTSSIQGIPAKSAFTGLCGYEGGDSELQPWLGKTGRGERYSGEYCRARPDLDSTANFRRTNAG